MPPKKTEDQVPGAAPAVIRCTRPAFVPSYPFRREHSFNVNYRDVFLGEEAAWLWATLGPDHFEPFPPKE